MLIDVHAHLWLERPEESIKTVVRLCGYYQIDKVFISTLGDGYYPDQDAIVRCNDITAGFMRERPDLAEGLAYINPANPGYMDEMKRCIEDYNMRGVKLWVATFCDDERVDSIAEQAIKYGVPVLAHTFYKSVGQLEYESRGEHAANLGARYPELKFIAAHIGANVYHTVKSIKDYPNICVDFSGSYFRRDDIEYTIKHLGAERILFGSDMPGVFEDCLGKAESVGISDADREFIYYKNAVRLFYGGTPPNVVSA